MEQGVQALKVALPETPVCLQPHFKLLERRWTQCINSALSVHADVHQSSVAEHSQMFGNLRLAQMQPMDHFSDRPRSVPQQFDDLKTVRLPQRFQSLNHGEYQYALTSIFFPNHILMKEYITHRSAVRVWGPGL